MGAWLSKWNSIPFATKRARDGNIEYADVPLAFDIETSSEDVNRDGDEVDRVSWLYHWQVGIGENPRCVFGRDWGTLKAFFRSRVEAWNLSENRRAIFFVHNLGYEFAYLIGELPIKRVFARKAHDPIEVELGEEYTGVVFRCTLALWGTSLQKAAEDTPFPKGKDLDHKIQRFSDTPLTRKERLYCRNDVRAVCYKIGKECEQYGHIHAIPLTKTGKVRKVCRKQFGNDRACRSLFYQTRLNAEQYDMHLRAFIGGDVHCNAWAVGERLTVRCKDLTSDYPARMCFSKFPAGKPWFSATKEDYERARRAGWAYIVEYEMHGVKCALFPSLMVSHCYGVSGQLIDNGRVIKADSLSVCLTDVDDDITRRNYNADFVIKRLLIYPRRVHLPKAWRETILDFFYKKNAYKGVTGKEIEYALSKENLNSIYGMTVSKIVRDLVVWNDGEWTIEEDSATVEDYYKNPLSFLPYHIGVWVTAYAREELYRALWAVGKDDAVYWDTDSCKYIGDHEADFARINREILSEARRSGLPRESWDVCGHALGQWDDEGVCEFVSWGAKKYASFVGGKFQTTIAGLGKKAAKYIESCGGFSAVEYGFTIPPEYSGRTYSQYYYGEPRTVYVQGHKITTRAYCSIVETSYTLGASIDYIKFLTLVKGRKWVEKHIR